MTLLEVQSPKISSNVIHSKQMFIALVCSTSFYGNGVVVDTGLIQILWFCGLFAFVLILMLSKLPPLSYCIIAASHT